LRVYPGKLSVARTLGDIEAKDPDFQGIPNCISFEPEITKFMIEDNDDFLFLGCDGIFEKL
jgi:serine/threonine protein phosphatase PrpC